MVTKNPGGTTLYDLYSQRRMTQQEIADRYGVTRVAVRKWLIAAGISLDRPSVTKGRKKSPEHAAKLAENLKKARANVTDESRKKQGLSQRGREAPNKGKKWTPEERAKHMAYRATSEYRENLSKAMRGESNGQWRGGICPTDARLKHWSWKQARAACYERDNWTCQDCGVKCRNKVRIQAHHIIARRDGGGDELENLVTLCASCHRKREAVTA
jgi:predicted transcriptional regulator